MTTTTTYDAEHDGCGGELVAPMTRGGNHYAPPAAHPLAGNPDAFMVTCLECAAVNWYTDPTLKRLARKVAMRFVVQAVR